MTIIRRLAVGLRYSLRDLEGYAMRTILGWGGASILGAIGWWLGARLGLAAAVLLSALGGGVGLYYGNRWFDDNLK